MKDKKIQQKNDVNIFFNEYFNVVAFLIAAVLFVFAYFIFLGPKLTLTTMAISDNIAAQKKLYGEQEKRLNELKTINKVYNEILPSDLGKFNQILPSDYVKESLFGELEEIVIKHGFILGSVTIEADEEVAESSDMPTLGGAELLDSRVGEIRIIATVNAIDYNGFKRLLKNIEASARLFDIENISYSQDSNSLDLEIITYYYKTAQQAEQSVE